MPQQGVALSAFGALKLPGLGGGNGAPKPTEQSAAVAAPAPPKAAAPAPPTAAAPAPPKAAPAPPAPTPVVAAAPAPANGSTPKAAAGDVPPNVQEAREWIAAWRARTAKPANPLAAFGKLFG